VRSNASSGVASFANVLRDLTTTPLALRRRKAAGMMNVVLGNSAPRLVVTVRVMEILRSRARRQAVAHVPWVKAVPRVAHTAREASGHDDAVLDFSQQI